MIMITNTMKITLYTIIYCHLGVDACVRIQMWQQWFLAMSVLNFSRRESCVKCALCCVRNVSCLCSTSLPCNSTSRRRKERGSPTRFVMASVTASPGCCSHPPFEMKIIARPRALSHLLVRIRQRTIH